MEGNRLNEGKVTLADRQVEVTEQQEDGGMIYLEEVSVSIAILKSIIYVIRQPFPVADIFGIAALHWRTLCWIKSPVA